jgi:hypothetical protein
MAHDNDNERRTPATPSGENQGEGDRVSARRYNDHAREFVVYGDVDRAARDARDALDSEEAARLRAAEQVGRAPAQTSPMERARAIANRARHALGVLLTDLGHRLSAPRGAR